MQVCRKYNRSREQALIVLAFAFTEQLFIPLIHHCKCRVIGYQHFNFFSLSAENISDCSILVTVVVFEISHIVILCLSCAFHQLYNVTARHSNREQSNSSQNGKTSADIIRYNKSFITFCVAEFFQSALCLVGSCKNVILCFLLAVLVFDKFLEYTESKSRFSGCSGL